MAYNNQTDFWDYIRSMYTSAGTDHAAQHQVPPYNGWESYPAVFGGLPHHRGPHHQPEGRGPGLFGAFGPGRGRGGWGGRGRGRHCGPRGRGDHTPESSRSRHGSPERGHEEAGPLGGEDHPHGPRGPHEHGDHPPPPPHGPHAHGHGHHGGRRGRHGHHGPPPPPYMGAPFDANALIQSLASHPIAQAFMGQFGPGFNAQGSTEEGSAENSFTPPIDVFSTPSSYVLHIALAGAKKEDVGVNWDAEKSVLNIAGVVYRQGDEEFLKTLTNAERKIGVFERSVKLGGGDKEEEVDGDGITAKMEDGVLVVTIPKIEKEWTEVKRVDID